MKNIIEEKAELSHCNCAAPITGEKPAAGASPSASSAAEARLAAMAPELKAIRRTATS